MPRRIPHKVKNILKSIDAIGQELIRVARFIGTHPELAYEEVNAQKQLVGLLRKHGFSVKSGVAGMKTAFIAQKKTGKGPNIGFLCEYDALPDIGHACGHNLIGPASCGAAIGLAKGYSGFKGTISVIGCPAEEGGGGKVILAKNGIFKSLSVAMMVHPEARTEVIKKMLSLIEVDIEFFGKGSHAAAAPEKGINALEAAVKTFESALGLRKKFPKDCRIHGIFTSAGTKPNIIPDHAGLKYYIRSLDMTVAKKMVAQVSAIARKHAATLGARSKVTVYPLAYEPFHPSRPLGAVFSGALKKLNIKNEQGSETKRIGSSDVGNVGQRVPTIHPQLRICDNLVCHTPAFAKAALAPRAFKGMILAAKALALTGHELFSNPDHLKKITADFKKRKRR